MKPDGDERGQFWTDRIHLTTRQYAGAGNLAARQQIYRFQQEPGSLIDWALEQIAWSGSERVLDVGCGNGLYLGALRRRFGAAVQLAGFDLSPGMLADLSVGWELDSPQPLLAVADAQALPLPDASRDVALAMHMLYHVPDIPRAARELRRVVRPGGTLLAATNSRFDKRELDDLISAAFERVSGRPLPIAADTARGTRFALEGGADLLTAFAQVERHDLPGQLVIPEAEPVVRYLDSLASLRAASSRLLPPGVSWEMVMAEARRIVDERIAAEGAFRVRTLVGVFVCR